MQVGYIYIIENKLNNNIYIGKKKSDLARKKYYKERLSAK